MAKVHIVVVRRTRLPDHYALIVSGDPEHATNRFVIVELAAKHGIPAIYPLSGFVEVGGLMTSSVDTGDLFLRTAYLVDKILKGANPATFLFSSRPNSS